MQRSNDGRKDVGELVAWLYAMHSRALEENNEEQAKKTALIIQKMNLSIRNQLDDKPSST